MLKHIQIKKTGLSIPDFFAFGFILAALVALLFVARSWSGPLNPPVAVDLSLGSLPHAVFLSLSRILLSYVICLVTSLAIGYWAAHSRFAESIILPLIDIGQSIPALGFLPGFALAFMAIFPESRVGLELAAVLTLYTSMAWNLMLSFYASVKTIPRDYGEIIKAYGYGRLGTFLRLELPYAMNGIIWNSMLSFGGGWFFLVICESFTLNNQAYHLLGLGSFMSKASKHGDYLALTMGGISMVVILVVMDQMVWNPLLRWAERFQRMQPISADEEEDEKVLNFFTKSKRITNLLRKFRRKYAVRFYTNQQLRRGRRSHISPQYWQYIGYAILAAAVGFAAWGLIECGDLLRQLSFADWRQLGLASVYTLLRVNVVLILSSAIMIPLGLWLGSQPHLVKRLQPVIQVVAAFPAPMIFPLLLTIMISLSIPLSVGSVIFMMTGAQWYLLFNVISASAGVPENLVELARSSGMGTFMILRKVYLPAAFPQILTGLITAAGGAWNTSIVAEYVVFENAVYKTEGLGSYISEATQAQNYPGLVAAVILMIIVIVLLNRFFWARLYNLAESKYRLD